MWILRLEREVLHRLAASALVQCNIVLQGARDLGAQMPALVKVVDKNTRDELRRLAGTVTVSELFDRVLNRVIGHLAADNPGFHVDAAKISAKRRL